MSLYSLLHWISSTHPFRLSYLLWTCRYKCYRWPICTGHNPQPDHNCIRQDKYRRWRRRLSPTHAWDNASIHPHSDHRFPTRGHHNHELCSQPTIQYSCPLYDPSKHHNHSSSHSTIHHHRYRCWPRCKDLSRLPCLHYTVPGTSYRLRNAQSPCPASCHYSRTPRIVFNFRTHRLPYRT